MRLRILATFLILASVAPMAAPVNAQRSPLTRLYIHSGPDPYGWYGDLRYAGRNWRAMTTLLQGTFDITTGAVLPSVANLEGYDALWIDQRYGTKPTTTELNTMLAFAATGRRVVIVGENSYPGDLNFFNWSAPYVQALGGVQGAGSYAITAPPGPGTFGNYSANGCVYGFISTVFTHALTSGVGTVNVGCAGYAVGGTSLFSYNTATLWGAPQNVLTILDTNILDDYFGSYADSPQFQKNLVTWLDQSAVTAVPEPSTYAMFAPALLLIAAFARRRRSRAA